MNQVISVVFFVLAALVAVSKSVPAGILPNSPENAGAGLSDANVLLDQENGENSYPVGGGSQGLDGGDAPDAGSRRKHPNMIDASCFEPSEQLLQQQLMKKEKSYPNSPVFAVYPFEETEESRNSISGMDNPYPRMTPNFTCPLELNDDIYAEISDRALCPWTFTLDNDPNRFPKVMAVAACRCTNGCIDPSNGGQSLNSHCEPITYRVRVLRRQPGCDGGYYRYRFAWEAVPVACLCVKNRVYRGPERLT